MRERGLKFYQPIRSLQLFAVAPVRERGLKFYTIDYKCGTSGVAPVRERGLKLVYSKLSHLLISRSREGAWIEIKDNVNHPKHYTSLP